MRLFIGTLLNAATQDRLDRLIGELVHVHPDAIRAIPLRSAHLTYAFCPRADAEATTAMANVIRQIAAAHQRFDIALERPQILGPRSRPRLVCADISRGTAELVRLTADLFDRLQLDCPAATIDRGKSQHVTLARFRKRARRAEADAIANWLEGHTTSISISEQIDALQLVSSTLTAAGPQYQIVAQSSLARPAAG